MPVFGELDLRLFCRPPMGVPVTFGGVSLYADGQPICGILDQPQQIKLAEGNIGGVQFTVPQLRIPYNAFSPMPTSGDTITVNGTTYSVNEPTAEDDGGFLLYDLLDA